MSKILLSIAKNLINNQIKAGKTQTQIANETGLSQASINDMMQRSEMRGLKTIEKLFKTYDPKMMDFLNEIEVKK